MPRVKKSKKFSRYHNCELRITAPPGAYSPYIRCLPRDFHDPHRTHRLYAGFVNARARQTARLFQRRFGSAAMDAKHLLAAARYVALNPARARLAERAQDWAHSSAQAHLSGDDDGLVDVKPLLDRAPRFADVLETDPDDPCFASLRRSERIGRPLGSAQVTASVERRLGRIVTPGRRGRKPEAARNESDS